MSPVSYTHLDVYKRQDYESAIKNPKNWSIIDVYKRQLFFSVERLRLDVERQIRYHSLRLIVVYKIR